MKSLFSAITLIVLVGFNTIAQQITVPYDNPNLEYQGRIGANNLKNASEIYWAGSSVTLKFRGSTIKVTLEDVKGRINGGNYFNFIVDGVKKVQKLSLGVKEYTLAQNLGVGEHTVEIHKRNDWTYGTTFFYNFQVSGNNPAILSKDNKPLFIEFYGDSVTSGHAVEDEVTDRPEGDVTNNYIAYGAITARNYNANYTAISQSGIGLLDGYTNPEMPGLFYRLNPNNGNSKWNFAPKQANVVVINLLQNDAFKVASPNRNKYLNAYENFIDQIRGKYRNAKIVCLLGNMNASQSNRPWAGFVRQAVINFKNNKNDDNVYSLIVPFKNTGGHPNPSEQRSIANKLINLLDTFNLGSDPIDNQEEDLQLSDIPNQTAGSSFTFEVKYSAKKRRDIIAEIRNPNNKWLGLGRITVNKGTGTANITVNTNELAVNGNGYKTSALLVPVGKDWKDQIKSSRKNFNVTDTDSNPPNDGDIFYIVNRQTQKKIRPQNNADASKIIQVSLNVNDNNVKWQQVKTTDDYFYLKNVETGKYFRPVADGDGSDLEQRPTTYSGNYTQWKKVNTADGYFYLQNRQTKMYFRPTGNNNNDRMIQRPTTYSGNYTQWKFQSAGNSKSLLDVNKTNNSKHDIVIFPNPIDDTGEIRINLNEINKIDAKVELLDASGNSVLSKYYSNVNTKILINFSSLGIKKGVYVLKVVANGTSSVSKVVF